MTGLRPDLRARIRRSREAIAGAAVVLVALRMGWETYGLTRWLALPLGVLGLALLWTGVQRLRFRQSGQGPGVVEVDERRLVYWGPLTGGTVDLGDLLRLDLDPQAKPAHWLLTTAQGGTLAVPVNAGGAEALLDLFTALPGLRTEALLAAMARTNGPVVTLWQSPNVVAFPRAEQRRLH